MTGTLKARVNGAWVPILGSNPQVVAPGNALGIVAMGSFLTPLAPFNVAANTVTTITNPLSVFTAVGRRYRVKLFVRATNPATPNTNITFRLYDGGTQFVQADPYTWMTGPYQYVNNEWLFDGDGLTHSLVLRATSASVTALYLDYGNYYIEDVGPNASPALPIPATASAWTAVTGFQNNWVNFDTVRNAQYRKIGDEVALRGVVKGGTVGYAAAIFTLPVGFRPPTNRDEDWVVRASGAPANLTVFATGVVSVLDNTGGQSVTYLYLDGVRFSTTA